MLLVSIQMDVVCYLKDKPPETKYDMILAEMKKIAGSVEEIKDIKKDVEWTHMKRRY